MNFKTWLNQLHEKGWIQPIQFGMNRNELVDLFGKPDDTSLSFKKSQDPMIYLYEKIEFHFGPNSEDGLFLIFSNNEDGIVDLCIKQKE